MYKAGIQMIYRISNGLWYTVLINKLHFTYDEVPSRINVHSVLLKR